MIYLFFNYVWSNLVVGSQSLRGRKEGWKFLKKKSTPSHDMGAILAIWKNGDWYFKISLTTLLTRFSNFSFDKLFSFFLFFFFFLYYIWKFSCSKIWELSEIILCNTFVNSQLLKLCLPNPTKTTPLFVCFSHRIARPGRLNLTDFLFFSSCPQDLPVWQGHLKQTRLVGKAYWSIPKMV
jgi:hypothetical protein